MTTKTSLLKTKQHFEILDGLRGVAAIAVVVFHFMEMAYTDYSQNFIGHGFLAVDFFFCLSGFVIGYAYDDRILKMGIGEFFKSRMIRLHPLVVFGSLLGLLAFLFDPFGGHPEAYSAGYIGLVFLTSFLLIPFPVIAERFFNLFNLNAPAWSLFWEYIANIVYAFILSRLRRKYLVLLTMVSAVAICWVAHRSGNLMGGWGKDSFWDGGVRVAYSFSAGLLVYRSGWIIHNKLGFAGIAVLLALAFVSPFSGWNWLTEPLIVIIYFPFLIALGAGTFSTGAAKKICVFAGRISYPLYMTHYSVIWMFGNYYGTHHPGPAKLALIIVSALVLLILLAYLVMVAFDEPVRNYLAKRRKKLV